MAKNFLLKKVACLSLSKACIVFGLLDLVVTIFVLVSSSINYHQNNDSAEIFSIVISSIGFCTCSLMITGSIQNNRWLMVPHIILDTLVIVGFVILSLINICSVLASRVIIEVLWVTFSCSCTLALSILYWTIMVSRFEEVKTQQSVPQLNEVEMESC